MVRHLDRPLGFHNLCGEWPQQVKILRGPKCISRSEPFSHRLADAISLEADVEATDEEMSALFLEKQW